MKQVEKAPDVDAICLDNIDVLSKWRVEDELPIMEEAPAWLDEEQQQQQQGQEDEEEQEEEQEEEADRFDPEDFMEGDVASSAPPSTVVDASTPLLAPSPSLAPSSTGPGPSTVRGRPGKQPIIFSRKRGRGHWFIFQRQIVSY